MMSVIIPVSPVFLREPSHRTLFDVRLQGGRKTTHHTQIRVVRSGLSLWVPGLARA
ncbi:hypothetical protein BGY98DRAFT_946237, partial [Russula aff. rugulosa BPL654]